jgi:predicted metal-dependent peptidase
MTLESLLKSSKEKALNDSAGNIPSYLNELIKINKSYTIPWKRHLKMFINATMLAGVKLTRSRLNKRFGYLVRGKRKDYTARILIGLDTSGSMSGDRTNQVLTEIYGIYKNMNMELDVTECDTEIKEVFTYRGQSDFKITGRGGTDLVPMLEYAHKKRYDGVIVLTDGEFFGKVKSPLKQTLWVLPKDGTDSHITNGKIVRIV